MSSHLAMENKLAHKKADDDTIIINVYTPSES